MEHEIDENVSHYSDILKEFCDNIEEEQKRFDQLIESIHQFIHGLPQHEIVTGYKDKMEKVEESINMRFEELQLTSYKALITDEGKSITYFTCLVL